MVVRTPRSRSCHVSVESIGGSRLKPRALARLGAGGVGLTGVGGGGVVARAGQGAVDDVLALITVWPAPPLLMVALCETVLAPKVTATLAVRMTWPAKRLAALGADSTQMKGQ